MQYYLAIDIGASSGRHILGHLENGKLVLEEMFRFDNLQVHKNGHDCWDMDNLWNGIIGGLKACKAAGKIPTTVGIDTWGVDFVLLDENDNVIGDAVAYRDSRTEGMQDVVNGIIPAKELYARAGIQYQQFNTIYQLTALKREHPEQLEKAKCFLMIPDYFHFLLTGVKCNEYTEASTSSLINAHEKSWDKEILTKLGLPLDIFLEPSVPGTRLGNLLPEIQALVGFDATVILPASHDTGSAFLAVPAKDENAVYLSSGTWSLLGVENENAITTEESYLQNFTNEGGAWYRYRYLKNIMGLWMIQSIRRELNGINYVQGKQARTAAQKQWSFPDLIAEAEACQDFTAWVDVNRECFLAPESMIEALKAECVRTGQPVPETVGQIMQCVYTSLSDCYKNAIASLQKLTGKTYTSINIVGGGCQDNYLNTRTAKATGLPVYAGPVEGTAIGNLVVQMIVGGDFESLQQARDTIRESFDIRVIQP
ncbi:MAG: rhamnulokinase [Oscillospiraceae bacterium]|nr:rhamnulokinase [Oscillospiraceae bacterium]